MRSISSSSISGNAGPQGKFADPTLDLRPKARYTNVKPADGKWLESGFDDKAWTESPLSLFRFWGAEPGKPLWVRKTFSIPEAWRKRAGQIRVVSIVGYGPYSDSATVWLNGVPMDQIGSGFSDGHIDVNATKFLREGENVLAWEFKGEKPIQAFEGEVYLYFRPEPVQSIPLEVGEQKVFIPKSWEGKYRITLYLEGERYTISQARINGHSLGRGRPYPAPAEYNLLAYLKFGEDNSIWVNPGKKPEDVRISRLDLFPIDE